MCVDEDCMIYCFFDVYICDPYNSKKTFCLFCLSKNTFHRTPPSILSRQISEIWYFDRVGVEMDTIYPHTYLPLSIKFVSIKKRISYASYLVIWSLFMWQFCSQKTFEKCCICCVSISPMQRVEYDYFGDDVGIKIINT